MMKSILLGTITIALIALCNFTTHLKADDNIVALIDQLVNVSDPDTGYSQWFSGSNFLLYDDTESLGTFIIGATGREHSSVMRKLVEAGFDAVPDLLKHLDDNRKTKMEPIESGGFMWIAFDNEYDFNRATTGLRPKGVNLDIFGSGQTQPRRHETTVGDLCYVALGQILNRSWSASRYQPTGGRIISSPTYSADLKKAILDEWGTLDREGHRKSLIDDFLKPDYEERVVGAYLRLSFYYPKEIEKLVLDLLSRPIPDGSKASNFSSQLGEIKDAVARKAKLNEILQEHGQQYRDPIQSISFDSIRTIEIKEKNAKKLDPDELQARQILHETFGWPKEVTYEYWRGHPKTSFNDYEMARIIKALTHDDSEAIGDAVKAIMESERFKNDSYMVDGCLTCLASRPNFGAHLAEMLQVVGVTEATDTKFSGSYLAEIAKSKSPQVQAQLKRIVESTNDPVLFLIAAKATTSNSREFVLTRAKEILNRLPADTDEGDGLLTLIIEKSPTEAESILTEFLKPNTPARCNTVCEVLWEGNPLSQKILLPLLDDDRAIPGFTVDVRNRAAQAISHSIDSIRFDSDWSKPEREKAISRIKEYCQQK